MIHGEKYRPDKRSPPPGYTWNPLKHYPVNANCFCGSQEKFKRCCVMLVLDCCTIEDAEKVKIDMKQILAGKIRINLTVNQTA